MFGILEHLLYTTLANAENFALHQCLLSLLRLNKLSWTEIYMFIWKILPLHNGQSHAYCINVYGKSIRLQRVRDTMLGGLNQ